jgi:hypothetical protein
LWLGLFSLTLMAGLSLKLRITPIRLRRLAPILGASALLIAGTLAGCGGGSSSATTTVVTTTGNGTPAGTYAITFTATSPVGTDTRTVSLVVR